jgi:hypothetical protein
VEGSSAVAVVEGPRTTTALRRGECPGEGSGEFLGELALDSRGLTRPSSITTTPALLALRLRSLGLVVVLMVIVGRVSPLPALLCPGDPVSRLLVLSSGACETVTDRLGLRRFFLSTPLVAVEASGTFSSSDAWSTLIWTGSGMVSLQQGVLLV